MERDGSKRDGRGEAASTSARCSGPLTSLDLNYMQELVSQRQRQRQRGKGGRPAPNLFRRKSRSVEYVWEQTDSWLVFASFCFR